MGHPGTWPPGGKEWQLDPDKPAEVFYSFFKPTPIHPRARREGVGPRSNVKGKEEKTKYQ